MGPPLFVAVRWHHVPSLAEAKRGLLISDIKLSVSWALAERSKEQVYALASHWPTSCDYSWNEGRAFVDANLVELRFLRECYSLSTSGAFSLIGWLIFVRDSLVNLNWTCFMSLSRNYPAVRRCDPKNSDHYDMGHRGFITIITQSKFVGVVYSPFLRRSAEMSKNRFFLLLGMIRLCPILGSYLNAVV